MESTNNYMETDLGNVSPNPKGTYDNATAYEYLDLVEYQGGSYLCTVDIDKKVKGISPTVGQNSETWQLVALPGTSTEEYVAKHTEVIEKAKQVETSRAAVELCKQEVESAQADVEQMRQDTQQAAQNASDANTEAQQAAQQAEAYRSAAQTSEQNAAASRNLANTYKANAETAKSAAETAAQNATESKTAAETAAQNAAQSKADIDSIKEGIEEAAKGENVSQIQQNMNDISQLKESLSNKITKFYASNEGKNHLADSDNGKIMDMMLYGKSEQFTTTGKNLFKIKDGTQTTRGVTVTVKDGVFALKGTATETGWAILDIDSFVLDGTCILSSNITTNTRVSVANKSYKLVLEQNKSNTLENAEVSKVCFNITEGKTYDISNILIQIEKGSVATSYEPYTGGIPSPNPDYPQEIKSVVNPTVKIVGKNLLNATLKTITLNGVTCINNGDGTYTLNGTPTVETDFYIYGAFNTANMLPLDSQKTYIVKKSGNSKIQFHVGEPGIYTTVASLEDGQIKNRETISFFICRILSGAILNNFTIYPQVEEGSASTDFQPYHEQTVALPYTLNAIPVSSGGNVTINGQQYVADYVDVERGKVVRKCERKTLNTKNGKIDEEYRLSINIAPTTYNDGSRECIFSTFKWSNWGTCAAGRTIYIKEIKKPNNELYTAQELKELSLDFDVVYQLLEQQETDLTAEQTQAFKALATYYPTTNISANSEQLDGYTVFNYPISMQNGWNYVKQQLNDNRDYIYGMDTQSAEAYVNSEYAVALTELEVM